MLHLGMYRKFRKKWKFFGLFFFFPLFRQRERIISSSSLSWARAQEIEIIGPNSRSFPSFCEVEKLCLARDSSAFKKNRSFYTFQF